MPEAQEIPEWSQKNGDVEERSWVGRFGQQIREHRSPIGLHTLAEYFDDASREFWLGRENFIRVTFINPQDRAATAIILDREADEERLGVTLRENTRPIREAAFSLGFNSLAQLVYTRKDLAVCTLQPDIPPRAGLSKRDEEYHKNLGWQENIDTLTSYLRAARYQDLNQAKDMWEGELDFIRSTFIETTSMRETAENLAQEAIDRVTNYTPLDDRDEIISLLDKIGFKNSLMVHALERAKEEGLTSQALSQLDVDELLNKAVFAEIDNQMLLSSEEAINQQLLEVEFGDTNFSWREIEKELTTSRDNDTNEEIRVINEGFTTYGGEVTLQESIFTIDRAGDLITVGCLTKDKKPKWTASFRTEVPFDSIKTIAHDRETDFRQLRELLGIELKVA